MTSLRSAALSLNYLSNYYLFVCFSFPWDKGLVKDSGRKDQAADPAGFHAFAYRMGEKLV